MIVSFRDHGTEDLFNGKNTRAAGKACPANIHRIARRKLELLDSVSRLDTLRIPPGNELEELTRDRKGQHSIRINDQYRVCFRWTDRGPEDVEVTDYH